MRIIAGKYRGRTIECPKGYRIRPTSDKVRSAVFNILQTRIDWEESNVLDIFCGTGAYGIESFSRGAKFVGFVDNHRESIEATRHNLTKIHIDKNYALLAYDAEKLPKADRKYNVILIDPPYSSGLATPVLANLLSGGWLADDAIIIVEEGERGIIKVPEGFVIADERKYGNTKVAIIKLA